MSDIDTIKHEFLGYKNCIIEIATLEYEYGMALDSLWFNIDSSEFEISHFGDTNNFDFVKQVFFDVIYYAMQQGWLRLAKHGEFLTGKIDEQIQLFKDKFPKSKIDTLDKDPQLFHVWFFSGDCPAGAVWVYQLENGSEYLEWT